MSLQYNHKAYYNKKCQLRICYINQYKDHYKICYCKPDYPAIQYLPYVLHDYDSAVNVHTIWLNKTSIAVNKSTRNSRELLQIGQSRSPETARNC